MRFKAYEIQGYEIQGYEIQGYEIQGYEVPCATLRELCLRQIDPVTRTTMTPNAAQASSSPFPPTNSGAAPSGASSASSLTPTAPSKKLCSRGCTAVSV